METQPGRVGRSFTPGRNTPEKDNILTPDALALQIVQHYRPCGLVLDPCSGNGAFLRGVRFVNSGTTQQEYEIRQDARDYNGLDFFKIRTRFDWIASNPPYSILTEWLEHSFTVADNIVYLVQAPAPFFLNCPDEWKKQGISFGTGLAAVHWQRGYSGSIIESYAPDFAFPKRSKRGGA